MTVMCRWDPENTKPTAALGHASGTARLGDAGLTQLGAAR